MSMIQNHALRIGTQVAVYEIKELLGSNQSEIIYRAWSKRLNTTVILKEFFPCEYASRDEGSQSVLVSSKVNEFVFEFGLRDFIQLNEKLLEIQHPGAQTALNILELNQTAYLVVNDPKGNLLSEYLGSSEPYKEDELKNLVGPLLDTLDEFHNADIIHGDIHPGNILLKNDGKPVLLNFASTRQKFSRYIENPLPDLHAGYASPEQYLTRENIESSSDLYSLGAVIYRCISGVDPENGEHRLSELNKNNSDPLKSIIEKSSSNFSGKFLVTADWMLQPESTARPQSVSEVMPAFRKAKSSPKYTAGFLSGIKSLLTPALEPELKRKPFGVTTLAVSIFTSVALAVTVTSWFLGHKNELRHDEVTFGKPSMSEGTAFGKAVENPPKNTALNQAIPNSSGKSTDLIISNPEEALKKSQNEKKQIDEYMAKAKDSLAKFNLTTPAEKNAHYYYKQVLEISPDHEDAKKGTEKIYNQYVSLIHKAINTNDKPLAKLYLNRMKEVSLGAPLQKKTISHFDEILQGISPRPTIIPVKG